MTTQPNNQHTPITPPSNANSSRPQDPQNPTAKPALDEQGTGPLAGIVVADFSRVLAGPYATMLLADMGATVIKVESPAGDETRTWKPPVREDTATYYLSVNRNKHGMVLDLKNPDDLDTAHQLLSRADVFIENFKPGGLKKFGMDPETVATRWPHLIHASITGFGTEGGANLPGYDMLIQAASGLMSLTGPAPTTDDATGETDIEPQKTGVAIVDVVTGLHALTGILAALHERTRSGKGQHIAVNLLSSAVSGLVNQASAVVAGGGNPTRMGNDHPSLFPYGVFAAQDRDLVIACGNDAQFGRLCAVLGEQELAEDPRFATMSARNQNRTALRRRLEELLAARTAQQWVADFQSHSIPCTLMRTVAEGIDYATELGLAPVQPVGPQDVPTIKHPIDYSRTPARYDLAPPQVGEHTETIKAWLAGQ